MLQGCAANNVRTDDNYSVNMPSLKPIQTNPLKLSFIIDMKCDADHIIVIFRNDDPAGIESRAKSMGLDIALAKRFQQENMAIVKGKSELEMLWKDLINIFSSVGIEIIQTPWVYEKYICVVSAFHPGLSNWSGNKVAIKFDRKPIHKRRILAHEILLSNIFQIFRQKYQAVDVSDWQVWAFSEITTILILNDSRLRSFGPEFPLAGQYIHNSNYPQLAKLEIVLKKIFDDRKSFADYLEKSAFVLKEFKQTHSQM